MVFTHVHPNTGGFHYVIVSPNRAGDSGARTAGEGGPDSAQARHADSFSLSVTTAILV